MFGPLSPTFYPPLPPPAPYPPLPPPTPHPYPCGASSKKPALQVRVAAGIAMNRAAQTIKTTEGLQLNLKKTRSAFSRNSPSLNQLYVRGQDTSINTISATLKCTALSPIIGPQHRQRGNADKRAPRCTPSSTERALRRARVSCCKKPSASKPAAHFESQDDEAATAKPRRGDAFPRSCTCVSQTTFKKDLAQVFCTGYATPSFSSVFQFWAHSGLGFRI